MPSNDGQSKTKSSAYAKAPAKMPSILPPVLPFQERLILHLLTD